MRKRSSALIKGSSLSKIEQDDGQLRTAESCVEERADVLCVREVKPCIYLC
jgi:hypothetical protein